MKKLLFLICVLSFLFFTSCTEIGPTINPSGSNRVVLVEEFTGVKCVNCPEGSEQIEQLLDIHGDNLIAVSIHSGFFSTPYPESNYDFRTEDGTNIENLLGPAIGYPIATINRKTFPSESEALIGRNKWAGYISQEKDENPKVDIIIEKDYDSNTRELSANAKITFNETVSAPLRITAMITENNIQDTQLTPEGKLNDYTHKHVLRSVLTNFDGNNYVESTTINSTSEQTFSTVLPVEWNENNCSVIIFIHEFQDRKDVLQASEIHVTD